jgi:hypothetical protein
LGQSEKNSARVYVFRFALKLRHWATQPALRICATSRLMHAASFDHLGRKCEEGGWHDEAEFLGGLQIDNQLKSSGLLDRQIAGF